LAELKIVDLHGAPGLPHEHQFMLRAVERAYTGVFALLAIRRTCFFECVRSAPISLRGSGLCGALAGNFVEGEAGLGVNGILAGEGLPALDGDVDETRLELQRVRVAPDALRRQDRRA